MSNCPPHPKDKVERLNDKRENYFKYYCKKCEKEFYGYYNHEEEGDVWEMRF